MRDLDLKKVAREERNRRKIAAKRQANREEFHFRNTDEEPELTALFPEDLPQTLSQDASKPGKRFCSADQFELASNEYFRYVPSTSKVAHALISSDADKITAVQFQPPAVTCKGATWRPILDISDIKTTDHEHYRAQTPDHFTPMIGTRSVRIDVTENGETKHHELFCFDQAEATNMVNTRSKTIAFSRDGKHLELGKLTRKAKVWPVTAKAVIRRDRIKRRRTQKDVMGRHFAVGSHRAQAEGANFLMDNSEILHEHRINFVLARNVAAEDQHYGFSDKAQWRFEWVHAMARSLAPLDRDPQTADNLAAAPKWINTQMRILERTAKWVAENRPNATIKGETIFYMIPNSDILEKGKLKFSITEDCRTIEVEQDLIPWQTNPSFNRPSDVWQTTMVVVYLLLNQMEFSLPCVKPSLTTTMFQEITRFMNHLLGFATPDPRLALRFVQ